MRTPTERELEIELALAKSSLAAQEAVSESHQRLFVLEIAKVLKLRAVLEPICDFAWSAVKADCDEACDHLNELIASARKTLKETDG